MRIRVIGILGFMNLDRREKRLTVGQIKHLSHGHFAIGVQQTNLVRQSALCQCISKGGPHRTGPDNHHLSWFPIFVIHLRLAVVLIIGLLVRETVMERLQRGNATIPFGRRKLMSFRSGNYSEETSRPISM
jgi:hypothetical protein